MGSGGRQLDFRILGPLEVVVDGRSLALGGQKQKELLALLVVNARTAVSTDRLVEELWGGSPPATAVTTIQVYVSRLRKLLEPTRARGEEPLVLVSRAPGYALELVPEQRDLDRFDRLSREGREALGDGRLDDAVVCLERALGLWRGPALADFGFAAWAQGEAARLEEKRLACVEDRIEADLACGRHAELAPEIEALIASNPLRERLWGQLLIALYRSGRQAEALDAYQQLRGRLVEELGIDPKPELQELHRAILNQDESLAAPAPVERRPRVSLKLPAAANPLIGRQRELEDICGLLASSGVRLVTITGPGGVGKTRLSLAVATQIADGRPEGAVWVGLQALRDPSLVMSTIAQALEVEGDLEEALADRELLLCLDNFEQVLAAGTDLAELLTACPTIRVLVTSRELLHVSGEHEYPLAPLGELDAAALFAARARAVQPGFEADEEVEAICRRLDNLPLAIELAAARVKVLTTRQLRERLELRLPILGGGPRDVPERQRTLTAAIAWSHDLLGAHEQSLFAALSVFAGGCTLDAAEQICGAELDSLQSLVEKSLVRHSDERFWMLETIREYAAEQLAASPASEETHRRHAEWVQKLTTEGDAGIKGPDAQAWLERLEPELDNLRAAFTWLCSVGATAAQLELVSASGRFLTYRGSWSEGLRWADAALAATAGERTDRRARALRIAGSYADALGERERGQAYEEEGLSIFRELGDSKEISAMLISLANNEASRGDLEAAERLLGDALLHAREAGDRRLIAYVAGNRGSNALERGDHALALELTEEALELFRELGHEVEVGWMLSNRAYCLLLSGHDDDALVAVRESSAVASSLNQRLFLVWSVVLLSRVISNRDEHATAARLCGLVDAECERTGLELAGTEAAVHRGTTEDVRAALGPERFERAHTEGSALSLEEALELALAI